MSNAAKHRKKAAEFEQLRQIDRAIASYIKAIEQSEVAGEDIDVALFNKVGDLTLRQGRVAEAVTYYERAVEHYSTAGLFNNAIALCNKILRSAPGRANVYYSLGRICARKGLRGDATRNFLEYATRMQQAGRLDEGMRALEEVAQLMPELEEVQRLVEEHAARAGVTLTRRSTPVATAVIPPSTGWQSNRSSELVFLDPGVFTRPERATPPMVSRVRTPPTPAAGVLPFIATFEEVAQLAALDDDEGASDPTDVVAAVTPDTADVDTIDGASDPVADGVDNLQSVEALTAAVPTVDGLELPGDDDKIMVPLHGLHSDEDLRDLMQTPTAPVPELTWLVPEDEMDEWPTEPLPFRLDPHDFILSGELPPLILADALVEQGLSRARHGFQATSSALHANVEWDLERDVESEVDVTGESRPANAVAFVADVAPVGNALAPDVVDDAHEDTPDVSALESDGILRRSELRSTPSLPIAAVAIEANVLAASRRDELRAAVSAFPQDWTRRRQLAEALFEAGEREAGLAELQAALSGFAQNGNLESAAEIADELVALSPDRIPYHQKRVEFSVRLNSQQRLRLAYLDLADTLVRTGDDARAHAVFARVLELDPLDTRARSALGSAAPPPPPTPTKNEDFVDLGAWLREDAPISTRMRMQEPTVSGDEQADFDALLRHFKHGVARSLGEEDFESRYDLGVAYKEMGLLDDAIGEFQKALRSSRHRLPAYEALGQCFVEQTRYSVAVTVLTRAIHEPGLDDQHLVGVLYLLAHSCDALQRRDDARRYYSRVYTTDIKFRDVAARLAALDEPVR